MTDWVRLWHDMPTDPKWRVVARKSGQPLSCVIAVFTLMLTDASANADARGSLLAWDDEDAAAALDMDTEQVAAIRLAMQGKVLDGDRLTGWERRQPKREDDSAARVRKHRETKAAAAKRDVTQCNAPDTETETEKDTEDTPHSPPAGGRRGKTLLPVDWQLPEVSALPPKARACAEQWTRASYETHGEAFASYWRSQRKMQADWLLTWANRVIALHAQVMRDQKYGNAPTANGQARVQSPEDRAKAAAYGKLEQQRKSGEITGAEFYAAVERLRSPDPPARKAA